MDNNQKQNPDGDRMKTQESKHTPKIGAQLHGAFVECPADEIRNIEIIANLIFGFTPSDANDKKCAKWSLYRAASVLHQIRGMVGQATKEGAF